MRFALIPTFALAFGAAAFVAPDRAEAAMGIGRQSVLPVQDVQLVEEVASRKKRVAKRRIYRRPYYTHRRPYYVPYACARPYKYYYWQFWPPVCYPL